MSTRDRLVPNTLLYDLPFDQFSRQYLVKTLVESRRSARKLRILDVGGNNGKTREFFPSDEVIVADLYDVVAPWYVKANALDLPFEDDSFDIVVCFDVYEHIAANDRTTFVNSLIRVSRDTIYIAAPFDTEMVHESEVELNSFYKKLSGEDHRWLREHIDNTLPNVTELEGLLRDSQLPFSSYSSNNILLWSAMQSLIFLADTTQTPERLRKLNNYFNRNLLELGDAESPSYRQIYAIDKHKSASLPKLERDLDIEKLRQLINLSSAAVYEIAYSNTRTMEMQAAILSDREDEIRQLTETIARIQGSISWRIATLMSRLKRTIVPRRATKK